MRETGCVLLLSPLPQDVGVYTCATYQIIQYLKLCTPPNKHTLFL